MIGRDTEGPTPATLDCVFGRPPRVVGCFVRLTLSNGYVTGISKQHVAQLRAGRAC